MSESNTYIVLRKMLQSNTLIIELSEFAKTLQLLEKEKLITTREHIDLLEFAEELQGQKSVTNT
jgi:hypothetical protein